MKKIQTQNITIASQEVLHNWIPMGKQEQEWWMWSGGSRHRSLGYNDGRDEQKREKLEALYEEDKGREGAVAL